MKKVLFMLLLTVSGVVCVNAQVTIGSSIEPTKGALLELKTQQANGANVTSTSGGFVLPRVALVNPATLEPFVATTDPDWTNGTLLRNLIGLLVYNVGTTNGLEEGVLIWKGAKWEKVSTAHPWTVPTSPTLKHATHEDGIIATSAQVTFGINETSAAGSLLQVKDIASVTDDAANATKGIVLPRVKLTHNDELYPMFLTDPTLDYNAATNPGSVTYLNNKDALKKSHVGLVVYNTDDTGEGLAKGFSQWDGKEWTSFQAKMGNAKFASVTCSDITVNGVYIEHADVGANNYLTVAVTVEKIGSYTISVKSRKHGTSNGNGYNFYLTGVAMETGPMTLTIPSQGRPSDVTLDETNGKDDLFIEGLPVTNNLCENKVKVMTSVATYALNCASVTVNGQYQKGVALTADNTIQLTVAVTTAGSYSFTTPLTNGIRFSATSSFPSPGTHSVTLIGSGTPTQHSDHTITINANTPEGNNQCTATIPITLPRLTYAVIGNGDYSWRSNVRRAAFNGVSFGPTDNAKVRIVHFGELWNLTDVDVAATRLTNGYSTIVDGVTYTNAKPDVVLYFAYLATPNGAITSALTNYVNNGGVLIYGSADNTESQVRTLINGIFGQANWGTTGGASGLDNTYQINNMPEDPIINGPFGNLANRYWGEDNGGSVYVTALPPNSTQICSFNNRNTHSSESLETSIVWYNNTKNFVYFGDCVGASTSNLTNYDWPAIYTVAGLPLSKRYGYWTSTVGTETVFNAALELNAVAWAIRRAAVSGINPH